MKKMGNHNSIPRRLYLSLALILSLSLTSFAQDAAPAAQAATTGVPIAATATPAATQGGDPVKGKELFNANCAACHKLDAKATGPALRGVGNKYDKQWLYKWIHNSADLIKSGDAQAVKIYDEYKPAVMNAFPQLSEADIDNVIAYTMEPKAVAPAAVVGEKVPGTEPSSGGVSNNIVLGALSLVMAILIVMLLLVNNVLSKIAAANGIVVPAKTPRASQSLWKVFAKNQFLVLVSAIFMLLAGAYFFYGYLMQIGVDQDYAPVQPIH